MTPRFLRMSKAPAYLGMSERAFNQIVRPNVREVIIGVQGVAFDREELDQWADKFMEDNAVAKDQEQSQNQRRTGRCHEQNGGNQTWRAKASAASTNVMAFGTSIKSSKANAFSEALEQVRGKKRKNT